MNDSDYVRKYALLTGDHITSIPWRADDSLASLREVFATLSSPGDITSLVPLLNICKYIKRNYDAKVLLCGLGADEIFHGYRSHRLVSFSSSLISFRCNKISFVLFSYTAQFFSCLVALVRGTH